MMYRILFVCHGNICRSPMAESIFMHLVSQRHMEQFFHADSAAVSREEIGRSVYPPAQRELARHGVPCIPHHARQMTASDIDAYDLLVGMDASNITRMKHIVNTNDPNKIRLLLSFTNHPRDVADPWYSARFDLAFDDIEAGCKALLSFLQGKIDFHPKS